MASDNLNIIYFLKSNEELPRKISKCHLQETRTLVILFVWEDKKEQIFDRYSIVVFTPDCSSQWIVLNEENSVVNHLNRKETHQLKLRRQHPLGIPYACFHKEISMLVVVGPVKGGVRVWILYD